MFYTEKGICWKTIKNINNYSCYIQGEKMKNRYKVQQDGESLVARLIGGKNKRIKLIYTNAKGDKQRGIYKDGCEISTKVIKGK